MASRTYYDILLGVGETTDDFQVSGECDVWVMGLTSGSVKLQIRFPGSDVEDPPVWRDLPDGSYSYDFAKTVFSRENGTDVRAVGVGNNSGVYVRFGRGY